MTNKKSTEVVKGSCIMRKDWIECKIGDVFNFVGGGTPSTTNENYWNGDIPWASIKDIKGDFLNSTINKITNDGLTNSASNLVAIDEVILATRINPGRPIISKINTSINQDLKVVKPKLGLPSVFVFYLFKFLEKQIIGLSSGTTVLGIGLNTLKDIKFSLPPLPEQRAIVKKLESLFSSLDAGVANLKKSQQQLKIYRQAVLKQTFDKLTEFTSIGSLVEMQAGLAFKKSEYSNNGIRLFQIANVSFNKTKWDSIEYLPTNYKEKYPELLLNIDDIVMALNRPLLNDNLKIAQIKSVDLPSILYQRVGRFHFKNNILNKYFLYYLQSPNFIIWLKEQLQGVNIPFINKSKLFSYSEFPICSLDEQHQIIKQIESRLSVCDSIEQNIKESLEKAEALRQSILKKAFEGNLLTADELAECKLENDYETASVLLERIKVETKKK